MVLVFALCPQTGLTQWFSGGGTPPNGSRVEFNQELNIFEWRYALRFDKLVTNRLRFGITERFQTTLQQVAAADRWKDQQDLNTSLVYPFSSKLSLGVDLVSHVLRDPLAGFDNDVTHHAGTAALAYRPRPNLLLQPQVAAKWQSQLEQSDQGLGLGLTADATALNVHGYESEASLVARRDFFPRRTNEDVRLHYQIARQFYAATADTLRVVFERLRRDSFDREGAALFVRNLTQETRGIENRLSYRLSSAGVLYVRNLFRSHTFAVKGFRTDTTKVAKDDAGFDSEHLFSVRFSGPRWIARADWRYRFRSQDDRREAPTPDPFDRHPSVGFDTEDVFVEWNLTGGYRLSHADSLGVFVGVSKFEFQTTDRNTPNDHDLQKWQASLSHTRHWSPHLTLRWQLSAFLNHFVFVSKRFSDGSNWERVLQLTPVVTYRSSARFSTVQAFTVRARPSISMIRLPAIGIR